MRVNVPPTAPDRPDGAPELSLLGSAPIRVLHVIATLAETTGGPAKAALEMTAALAKRGHQVAIYTTDREQPPGRVPADGAPVTQGGVEVRTFRQVWPATFGTSPALGKALAERVPAVDVVHVHSLYLYHDWAAWRACRRAGKPYVLRPHGTLDPFLWKRHRRRKQAIELWFQNRMLQEAAAIHYTADEEMALAAPYARNPRGVVVPNGLDLSQYARLPPPGTFRRAHPEIGGRRIVLFLGRINFKKGLDVLVPGFARAAAKHPDLQLVIAGPDDGLKAETERWVREQAIEGRVTFTGMLTGEAKLAAFSDAYMFVLPSYSENFGIAVVEAMACGVPVAISDKVNIWRDVEKAGAGLIGPPTVDAVAAQIDQLAAEPGRVFAMASKGRALVHARFSWDHVAGELDAMYRNVLAAAGARADGGRR